MTQFMVEIKLPMHKTQHFRAWVEEQRIQIQELMTQGIILTVTLNADWSYLWLVMVGESKDAVLKQIEKFHLYKYMRAKIHPLALFDTSVFKLPPLVMN